MSERQYTGLGNRKSHRKSRLGCITCKRRRIKCDESKPSCSNCTKHAVSCSYPNIQGSPSAGESMITLPSEITAENTPIEWGPITAELMHHWSTSTSYSFADEPELQEFMRMTAPRIAFANEHVLHMILGISALHLARLKPNRERYMEYADKHYQVGLRLAIPLLSELSQENCHSIFLFASICCGYSLAKGPKEGDFLLFSDSGPAEWSVLFQGLIPVLRSHTTALMNGPLASLIHTGAEAALREPAALPTPENEHLAHLSDLIRSSSASIGYLNTLEVAMDHLLALFSSRYYSDGRKGKTHFQQIGIWLYRCTTSGLTTLLQERHPAALAMFAYACVVFNELGGVWAMSGWVVHLLTGIYENLSPQYHSWIQWPMQQIGWLPP